MRLHIAVFDLRSCWAGGCFTLLEVEARAGIEPACKDLQSSA